MSWSARLRLSKGNLPDDFDMSNVDGVKEHEDQFEAAAEAAVQILTAGVVGDNEHDHEYLITMTGHGNPDHMPQAGWANDFVTITVQQL